jgi:phosphatidylglycerophosphate synthase
VRKDWIDRLIARSEQARAKAFQPILVQLDRAGLTADIITHLRLGLGGLFFVAFYFHRQIGIALFLITLLSDMFDGALARFQGNASDRGKFFDLLVDQAVYFLMLMHFLSLKVTPHHVLLNLFLVLASYVLASVFHAEGRRTDWIIAPYPRLSYLKSLPIVAFLTFVFVGVDYMHEALVVSNIIGSIVMGVYYLAMQVRWHRRV